LKRKVSEQAATDSKKQHLLKPNPDLADRQEQAHAHQILLDPLDQRWALVCDLGTDIVYSYELDSVRGALSGASTAPRHLRLPEGSGPRHLDFAPGGKPWVYITCELSGEVVCASLDRATGDLTMVSSTQAMPEGMPCSRAGHRGNADLHISADGKFVYTTTRTDHHIVGFTSDLETGALAFLGRWPTLGKCPRNFHLDEESSVLRVVNQGLPGSVSDSGGPELECSVVTYKWDKATGQ
jgi:6-phosphogluconolactonase